MPLKYQDLRVFKNANASTNIINNEKYPAVFQIIEFLLPGQKFISTLLSDILTILGIIWACKVFLDCFYN
jgi:hypothetical protein